MKTLLLLACLTISMHTIAQKTIKVTNASEMANAMDSGSFIGTSDIGASVRISEFEDHLIMKNFTSNSEIKIIEKTREEKTTEKATGLAYSGTFNTHPVRITMVVQEDKIRARIRLGDQKMVVVGVIKANSTE